MTVEELKISIIVPVYKVENYLDRCVSSLVNQTYRNLEILLVDDGSPDYCPAMCDTWAEKDSRIRVIHKNNGGLSDARNTGMAEASGELMGFVDSDDWVTPDMYQLLFQHMSEDHSDISACGVTMEWDDGTPSRMLTPAGCRLLSRNEAMEACINENWLKQPVWYKLYKTKLIRDLAFPAGKCHEDVFWSYLAIGRAASVTVFDTPCYHYLQRTGSIMGAGYSLKRLDALEAKHLRQCYLEKNSPKLMAPGLINLWFSCMYAGQQSLKNLNKSEQNIAFSTIRKFIKKHPMDWHTLSKQPFSHRLWCLLMKNNVKVTCRVRNFLNIGN